MNLIVNSYIMQVIHTFIHKSLMLTDYINTIMLQYYFKGMNDFDVNCKFVCRFNVLRSVTVKVLYCALKICCYLDIVNCYLEFNWKLCLTWAHLPMPPLNLKKGTHSLFARTFFRNFCARDNFMFLRTFDVAWVFWNRKVVKNEHVKISQFNSRNYIEGIGKFTCWNKIKVNLTTKVHSFGLPWSSHAGLNPWPCMTWPHWLALCNISPFWPIAPETKQNG